MRAGILVIDDEEGIRELAREAMVMVGFEVLTALDGERGLRLFGSERPDLVILDLMLPGLSGIEVCRRLKSKSETRQVPIILISARSEEVDRVRGLETGADDYVTKPFNPEELDCRVQFHLRMNGISLNRQMEE